MDPLALLAGAVGGGLVAAAVLRLAPARTASRDVSPTETPGSPAPGPAPTPVPAPSPSPMPSPAPAPEPPPVRVVALRCPQCGGPIDDGRGGDALRCAYCDVPVHVEGRRALPRAPARPRRPDRPPAWQPAREPAVVEGTFGRFGLAVLRQTIHDRPRETLRWVPIDAARAGLVLLRVVDPTAAEKEPLEEPALLEALATAAVESLRARRDPGLAAKAALRALAASGAAGALEAFIAVFDAERSRVVPYDAGCPGALVHASIEERRTIDAAPDRHRVLERLALSGEPAAFQNGEPIALAADDAVVVASAGVAGDGRGWSHGARSVHDALRAGWPGAAPVVLARSVIDTLWNHRETAHGNDQPPCGDLFVAALVVRGNRELRAAAPVALEPRTFATERFELALAPSPGAHVAFRPLAPARRAHVLVWLEGADEARFAQVVDGALEVLGGQTGDNDNPRAAGRAGLAAAGLEHEARLLVLWLGDEHGKAAFFQRGWRPPLDLLARGERGGSGQQFDEGGEHWPKGGGRLVFPGALPVKERCQHLDALPDLWPGGKASALYATCQHHEDEATPADLLRAVAAAARVDAPDAPLDGLAVLARRAE